MSETFYPSSAQAEYESQFIWTPAGRRSSPIPMPSDPAEDAPTRAEVEAGEAGR